MIRFGTGGWREIIGDQFTKSNVRKIAKAIADIMHDDNDDQKGICIGFDRRFLSDEAAKWAAEVFAKEGIHVHMIEKAAPTPLVMYTVEHMDLPYGMAVTASHNPALYNGIKVFTKGGRDATEDVTRRIEQYIEKQASDEIAADHYETAVQAGKITSINLFNQYIDDILAKTDVNAIRQANLKVVLDPMYGVSQTALRTLLMTTRCDLSVIHDRHDTLFGGKLPTPTSASLNKLRDFVVENRCDIGIATDGDADRIGVIDDTGRFLHPNAILVLIYYYMLAYKGMTGDVVRNVATTHLLDAVATKFHQQCHEVNVGFKHISSKMAETDAIVGGESSGGLTIKGHINGKDGIYAAMILIEMIAVTGKKLSMLYREIEDQFGTLYFLEKDYRFLPEFKESFKHRVFIEKDLPVFEDPVKEISYADGCKIYFEDGSWLLIRFSGTEPVLRLCCEMKSQEAAEKICAKAAAYYGIKES